MRETLFISFLLLLATACNYGSGPGSAGFPPEKQLDSSMRTVFVPVPDHPGEPGDNIVYAASFALAWDELARILGSDPAGTDPLVRRLNAADIHEGAHAKEAYEVKASVTDDELRASAVFAKALPFAVPFSRLERGMLFDRKTKVRAFGMARYDGPQAAQMQLLYYSNDDLFVLRLTAGPERDEILLAKGFCDGVRLSVMTGRVEAAVERGKKAQAKGADGWKYVIGAEDEVYIPEIRFHLSTEYRELINKQVMVRGQTLHIIEAAQRTAFVLDEKGIILESESVVGSDSSANAAPPKLLHFDKPFLIMIREQQAKHPYFIMKVANTECMVKAEKK
ncbi:hypothetical protein WJU16_21715 [Chitinophaga pollutisoli]|uniref:Serpin domain-containing protein n=1 Tax=Chitinophaga pollutisoli TaxID=3133966 RepID=A0ABZ2YLF1_9BACT